MRLSGKLPSLCLAMALTAGAGFPGLQASSLNPPIRLMSMTEIQGGANGHYFVDAAINSFSVKAIVDTGASAVALSYEDAESAGLHPGLLDFDVPVSTANGETKAARVTLDRVEIDNVRVDNVEAFVLPQGALSGTLLGMSFLSKLSSFSSENGILTLKN